MHIRYQHGAKTGKTSSAPPADAGIDDSRRAKLQQLRCEHLRPSVAVGRERLSIFCRAKIVLAKIVYSKIVKLRVKVGAIVEVVGDLFLVPRGFSQPELFEESNLVLSSLQLEAGIPGAAIGRIET